jgi:hypothetical protein
MLMPKPNFDRRFSLLGIIAGLMHAENLGDVADEINLLHDLAGIPRPEGDFIDGWTDNDMLNVGIRPFSID